MAIPKTIYQSWKENGNFPEHPYAIVKQIESWKHLNPNFEYKLFTDDDVFDFVKTEFPQYFKIFEKIPPIKRADLWRYMVIYQYGGAYFDLDCVCLRPIAPLIDTDSRFIAGLEHVKPLVQDGQKNGLLLTNWAFLAEAKHPILEDMIESTFAVLEKEEINFHILTYREWKYNVLTTTGPYHWSKIINKHLDLEGNKIGSKDWFGLGNQYSDKGQHLDWDEQITLWEDAVAHHTTTPGPNDNDPVYLLHTYLGSWKRWHKSTTIKNRVIAKIRRFLK